MLVFFNTSWLILGNHTLSRNSCFVFTIPCWPLCASSSTVVHVCRYSGMTRRFSKSKILPFSVGTIVSLSRLTKYDRMQGSFGDDFHSALSILLKTSWMTRPLFDASCLMRCSKCFWLGWRNDKVKVFFCNFWVSECIYLLSRVSCEIVCRISFTRPVLHFKIIGL